MKKSGILLVFLGLNLLRIAFYLQSSTESLLYFTREHWTVSLSGYTAHWCHTLFSVVFKI